jgi:hypothetical protein
VIFVKRFGCIHSHIQTLERKIRTLSRLYNTDSHVGYFGWTKTSNSGTNITAVGTTAEQHRQWTRTSEVPYSFRLTQNHSQKHRNVERFHDKSILAPLPVQVVKEPKVVSEWLTFLLSIHEVPSSNLNPETGNPGKCEDSGLQLGHERFLPNPLQFIIYLSAFHSTLHSLSYRETVGNKLRINT